MKKLFIYTQFIYPGANSESVLLTDILEFASSSFKGEIEVVCATDLGDRNELSFPNVTITRQKAPRFNKNKSLQRIVSFAFIALRFWWHALFHVRKGDVVFTLTLSPGYFMYMISLLRCVRRFTCCLLVYDVFPDNLIPTLNSEKKLWFILLRKVFRRVYNRMDRIISIGCDMTERLSRMVKDTTKIRVIRNWADETSILPKDKKQTEIVKKLGLENKTVFAFIGNISVARDIETLLAASKKIADPNVKILFLGRGRLSRLVEEHVRENPDGAVVFGGEFPIEEQSDYLNACDVALVTLGKKMYGIGVPSKTYFNMACAKPLLVSGEDGMEIVEMTRKYGLGEIVATGDEDGYLNAIARMAAMPDLKKLGKHVHDVFLANYSRKIASEQYRDFFAQFNE